MSCHLTESERARYAMMSAMGMKIERCDLWPERRCILPLGHGGKCVRSAASTKCDHDSGNCPLREKSRIPLRWDIASSWCIW